MELPANPPPTTATELERLGKKQALGKATNLGCPGFETPNAIATAVSGGPAKIPGKTAIPRGGETTSSKGSQTTAIATAIRCGTTTAVTAATPGGTATIETSKGKTGTREGRKTG